MENSKTQKEAITLGKSYVKELRLEPGVDTFSRWMAHYIAEKVIVSENELGNDRENAIKDCEQITLMLWNHRRSHRNYHDIKEIDKNFIRKIFIRIRNNKTE